MNKRRCTDDLQGWARKINSLEGLDLVTLEALINAKCAGVAQEAVLEVTQKYVAELQQLASDKLGRLDLRDIWEMYKC